MVTREEKKRIEAVLRGRLIWASKTQGTAYRMNGPKPPATKKDKARMKRLKRAITRSSTHG